MDHVRHEPTLSDERSGLEDPDYRPMRDANCCPACGHVLP
jgi:hypothetical protein